MITLPLTSIARNDTTFGLFRDRLIFGYQKQHRHGAIDTGQALSIADCCCNESIVNATPLPRTIIPAASLKEASHNKFPTLPSSPITDKYSKVVLSFSHFPQPKLII